MKITNYANTNNYSPAIISNFYRCDFGCLTLNCKGGEVNGM